MNTEKRSSSVGMIPVIVLLGLIVAAGAYLWNRQPAPNPPVVQNTATSQPESLATFFLATRNDNAVDDRSDASDREMSYDISSVNVQTLVSQDLGSIRANTFTTPFAYRDGGVYFVNGEGELSRYDFTKKTTERIAVPDIQAVFGFLDDHSMYDFMLSGDTIAYLQGTCTGNDVCHLREYNLVTKKMSPVIDNLEKKLLSTEESVFGLQAYDPATKKITILKTRTGEGPSGSVDAIEVFTETRTSSKVKTIELSGDPVEDTEAEKIYWKQLSCGAASLTQRYAPIANSGDSDIRTEVSSNGKITYYHRAHIVGCAPTPYAQ